MKMLLTKIKMSYIFAPLLAFLAPVKAVVILVGLFIAVDTCFGVWKSKKLGIKITSRGFSSVISKMFLYELAVLLAFAMETLILGDFIGLFTAIPLFLTKLVSAVLIGIEIGSINENWVAVKGYSLWDKAKQVLARAKEIKEDIDDIVPNKND